LTNFRPFLSDACNIHVYIRLEHGRSRNTHTHTRTHTHARTHTRMSSRVLQQQYEEEEQHRLYLTLFLHTLTRTTNALNIPTEPHTRIKFAVVGKMFSCSRNLYNPLPRSTLYGLSAWLMEP
jgi:hypothetical protein